jgi:NADH-quinone oxidoreductase subunit H
VLIPVSLVWIMLAAAMRLINNNGGLDRRYVFVATAVIVVFAGVLAFVGEKEEPEAADEGGEFDAFAGGYPVPPMSSATPSARPGSTVGKSET